jgi:hypothetical protein
MVKRKELGVAVCIASGLPSYLWPEFYLAAVYLLNLTPTEKLGWLTLIEALHRHLNGLHPGLQHPETLHQHLIACS